jgi:hypothetical protein
MSGASLHGAESAEHAQVLARELLAAHGPDAAVAVEGDASLEGIYGQCRKLADDVGAKAGGLVLNAARLADPRTERFADMQFFKATVGVRTAVDSITPEDEELPPNTVQAVAVRALNEYKGAFETFTNDVKARDADGISRSGPALIGQIKNVLGIAGEMVHHAEGCMIAAAGGDGPALVGSDGGIDAISPDVARDSARELTFCAGLTVAATIPALRSLGAVSPGFRQPVADVVVTLVSVKRAHVALGGSVADLDG